MRRGLVVGLLVLVSCGGDGGGQDVTPTEPAPPTDVGVEVAFPIEDAAAFRDRLLAISEETAADAPDLVSYNPYDAWTAEFPELEILGRDEPATPTGVSAIGAFFKLDDKDVTSADNPWVLSFAVADAGGGCAGGYLASTADDQPPDIFQQIEVEGACAATAAFPSAEDLPQ